MRVQEVDLARKRISLTMKLDAPAPGPRDRERGGDNSYRPAARNEQPRGRSPEPASGSAMAAAFAKLQGKR